MARKVQPLVTVSVELIPDGDDGHFIIKGGTFTKFNQEGRSRTFDYDHATDAILSAIDSLADFGVSVIGWREKDIDESLLRLVNKVRQSGLH